MKLAGWSRFLKQLTTRAGTDGRAAEETKPAEQPGPPAPVQADALKQMATAVSWLIAALAAVAAAMIAGSQLSSIGRLSWTDDRGRLLVAVLSSSVAIGLILLAIGILYHAQSPTNTDFTRLRKLAAGNGLKGLDQEVCRQVADDSTLHGGRGSLGGLMRAFDEVRVGFHRLKDKGYLLELDIARTQPAAARTAKQAKLKRLVDEREVLGGRMTDYRIALLRVAQLDKYLRTKARYRRSVWTVMGLSVVAGFAFVSFAWSANPPDKPGAAAAQRIVAAHLVLNPDGRKALAPRLGEACASAAAAAGGVPVLAVSSTDSGVEVIVVPSRQCVEAQHLVISKADGDVVADQNVVPPTPTPTPPR
jgi:hypothetical protein